MADRNAQLAVIQRMLDAGESEGNIATVIQHFKQTDTAPREAAPKTRPHQLRVPPDARISESAPFSGQPKGPLDSFIPAPEGLSLQGVGGMLRTNASLAERVAGKTGRVMTHVAKEYVPNWGKPFRGALEDIGGRLEAVPARREGLRAAQQVDEELNLMNARERATPGPHGPYQDWQTPQADSLPGSRPPTPTVKPAPTYRADDPTNRIIRPGPEAEWLSRNPSGGGAVNPKDEADLIKQYLLNFMRSGTGKS